MNVDLASAGLHAGMVEAFGLPTPTDHVFEEVFGPYHFDDQPTFWAHDPLTERWRVAVYNGRRNPASFVATGWPKKDRLDAVMALKDLTFLPAPPLPSTPTKTHDNVFLFGDFIFAWRYSSELREWELMPLAKR